MIEIHEEAREASPRSEEVSGEKPQEGEERRRGGRPPRRGSGGSESE
jgi:hypothetical protein